MAYKYKDSGLKKSYDTAYKNYNNMSNWNNRSKYGYDKYINNVNELYDSIMNMADFSYDPTKDTLFQMYKQQYDSQGRQSMKNAMGIGASLSGGYNSSAAQTAAQTQYLGYMDALNEKAADTYQSAMSRYNQNRENMLNQYNMAMDMNNAANDAYWKRLDVASARLNNAYNAYSADKSMQYQMWNDNRNFNLQKKLYTGK